jgi:hypothetical protein
VVFAFTKKGFIAVINITINSIVDVKSFVEGKKQTDSSLLVMVSFEHQFQKVKRWIFLQISYRINLLFRNLSKPGQILHFSHLFGISNCWTSYFANTHTDVS